MSKKKIQHYVFRLSEMLGQGSFGTVYKGEDIFTNQPIAVKVLNKQKINLQQYMKQALRLEIQILSKVKSDNIVRFIDYIETSNNFYIIQEYCNGGDLRAQMNKKKKFEQNLAIDYMAQLLRGFLMLIRNGVVHRDMKPQNILINDGQLKIADFGMAKPFDSNTPLLNTIVGTPLYQSPQLLAGKTYTYKCDVWALGMIFYEMLYGKLPWKRGQNIASYLNSITNKNLQFPQQIQISAKTKKLIASMLQIEQEKRADWNSIYTSLVFGDKLPPYDNLKEKYIYALGKMRKSIFESHINLSAFFHSVKLTKNQQINRKHFIDLIHSMAQDLTQYEIQYIFQQLDTNKNNCISLQEFTAALEHASIKKTSFNRNELKKFLSIIEDEMEKISSQTQNKFIKIIQGLRKELKNKQVLDLYELFINEDKNGQGFLKWNNLSNILKQIKTDLTEEEIQIVFNRFDKNKDSKITFEEFYQSMFAIVG